jgi:nucleoside-diphosphate-sugar epimerase
MRIAVTGGSGKAGRATVAALEEAEVEVVSIDVAASADPDASTLVVDLTDPGQAFEALFGFDAVVHLAAIPAPNIRTDAETFRNNMLSTYNVFSAATKLGHDRIVWASSETLIGLPFDRERPAYAPIDEDHPLLPESHYALSKLAGETIAGQFNRWSGIPIVSLRISNIMEPDDYRRFPSFWGDPRIRAWNLWGYVDARDVAQSVVKSLRADITGSEAFLIAADDTCMTQPSLELMAEVYPDVTIREGVAGHSTLLAIDKARGMLGYDPQHSWRDYQTA